MSYSNQPPDLEDIIKRGQTKYVQATGTTFADVARMTLAAGLILLAGSIFTLTGVVVSKLDQAQVIVDRGLNAMDKLPAATQRMETLLQRVDESVQKGFTGLKDAIPKASEGWLERTRNSLNKDPK